MKKRIAAAAACLMLSLVVLDAHKEDGNRIVSITWKKETTIIPKGGTATAPAQTDSAHKHP